jgi:thiamine biosynthesis lipoprotein
MALQQVAEGWCYDFPAMATVCEVRTETQDKALAERLGRLAQDEAGRIEAKYSRYRQGSVLSEINRAAGTSTQVDPETAALLDYAAHCHRLSNGLFDITSGVLRRVWTFDSSDRVPSREAVRDVLDLVGWGKVEWRRPYLTLRKGMEIDFGGIGKEFAVDAALARIVAQTDRPVLVNFGGDLRVSGPRAGDVRWRVGIESVDGAGTPDGRLELKTGALATSGDTRRFLLKDGVRYSHILDPRTGWPINNPPRSVTVAAPTCMEAGVLSTLAMLQGDGAEGFLREERLTAWWIAAPPRA